MAGIGEIALLAMQIGVHPGAGRALVVLLSAAMGLVPIALGVPPERTQRMAELGRLLAGKRSFETVDVHSRILHRSSVLCQRQRLAFDLLAGARTFGLLLEPR